MKNIIKLFLLISSTSVCLSSYAQSGRSGKSMSNAISFAAEEVREVYMLPNIEPFVEFTDANHNKVLDANESGEILVIVKNSGGKSDLVEVSITPAKAYPNILFPNRKQSFSMAAGEERTVSFPLSSNIKLPTDSLLFNINITERQGYDTKAIIKIFTEEYPASKLMLRGVNIIDGGIGTKAMNNNPDGKVQIGETVWAKVSIQNIGVGSTSGLTYSLMSGDPNIILLGNDGPKNVITGQLDDLASGKSGEIEFRFSPNNRFASNSKYLPIMLKVNEGSSFGNLTARLPIELNATPDELITFDIKPKNVRGRGPVIIQDNSNQAFEGSTIRNIMMAPAGIAIYKDAVAVVIGAEENKYYIPAMYASHDADVFREYLNKSMGISGSNILSLSNDEVSLSNLRDIFHPEYGRLKTMVRPGETDVFVYYSGHGIPYKNDGGKQDAYLLAYDARKEDISNTGYSLDKLCTELNQLKAKSVTLIVDACFSGSTRASAGRSSENLAGTKGVEIDLGKVANNWLENPSFRMLTSCADDEISNSNDISQSGLFTYYLALGLQGDADGYIDNTKDGSITMNELYKFVCDKVINDSIKIKGSAQTPQLYGNGNFLMEKIK